MNSQVIIGEPHKQNYPYIPNIQLEAIGIQHSTINKSRNVGKSESREHNINANNSHSVEVFRSINKNISERNCMFNGTPIRKLNFTEMSMSTNKKKFFEGSIDNPLRMSIDQENKLDRILFSNEDEYTSFHVKN